MAYDPLAHSATYKKTMTPNFLVASRALLGLALTAVVAACSTTSVPPPAAGESTAAHVRIAIAGVVVAPPPGAEWSIADVKARSVVYARSGPRPDNRWAAWVQVVEWVEPVEGYYQLARFVSRLTEVESVRRPTSEQDLIEPVSTARATCLRRTMRGTSATTASMSRAVDYFCRHPTERQSIVHVHLSQADAPGGALADVDTVAARFFSTIGFATTAR